MERKSRGNRRGGEEDDAGGRRRGSEPCRSIGEVRGAAQAGGRGWRREQGDEDDDHAGDEGGFWRGGEARPAVWN